MAKQRRPPFIKRLLPLAALVLLAAVLPLGSAAAQPAPQQVSLLNVPFRGVATPASTFDLVQSVIDFSPGATSSVRSANAQSFLSVFEGEVTVQIDGKSEVLALGKGLAIPVGAKVGTSNSSTGKISRVFVSTLASAGAVDPLHQPSGAGVKVFFTARRTMSNAPALIDVIQQGARYDPGFRTGNHVMNEFHLMVHLEGVTTYGYLDGSVERYPAGTEAVMYEGMAGWMANEGQSKTANFWTWLGTPGKPLTSAVTVPAAAATPVAVAPGPPRTGSGLAQGDQPRQIGHGLTIGSASFALLTLSVLALHLARRSRWQH